MNLPLRRRRQQPPQTHDIETLNPRNNNNNEELPTRRRISARLIMMMMCKYCKYPAIAIVCSGFLYSFVAIGIYLGEAMSDLGSYITRYKKNKSK